MYPMEADHMLSTFNLLEKRDTTSKSLSTGMKRKLSVMIALIGDSEVLEKQWRKRREGRWAGRAHIHVLKMGSCHLVQ